VLKKHKEELPNKTLSMSSSRRKSHKILMITDLHVRNSASEIQHNLDVCYEVSGFVKPGTGMVTIVNTA
jgi:hypothetical protein